MPDKTKLTDDLIDLVLELADEGRQRDIKRILLKLSNEDIAGLISDMTPRDKVTIFNLLDPETAGEVLDDVDPVSLKQLLERLHSDVLARILDTMPPDEAADAIAEAEDEDQTEILDLMEIKRAAAVRKILKYEEDTAGGIMLPHFVSVNANMTADQAIAHIRRSEIEEDIFYVYVVDDNDILVGIVPLRSLITASPTTHVREFMDQEVHTVRVTDDQEQVARVSMKYDLVAVPVVDDSGKLVGRILYDDIVDVVQEEATEDIYKLAGTTNEELYSNSSFRIARIRLPWLLITILGSLASGFIIHLFRFTIHQAIALASFIPVITATGGNSGLQSITVVVRGLATGHLSPRVIGRTIVREIKTALLIALAMAVLMALVARVWNGSIWLGIIVGASMFLAITMTTTLGVLIPLFFRSIKIDPAVASGPLVTMLNDIIGLLIYLSLATTFLSRLV